MPMFKKKPVVIEANQFDGTLAAKKALEDNFGVTTVDAATDAGKLLNWRIGTLEGPHEVTPGDWIIRGVKGEFYPCKDEIFRMTYEPADGLDSEKRMFENWWGEPPHDLNILESRSDAQTLAMWVWESWKARAARIERKEK